MKEEISASGHLILTQVRHNELLSIELVGALNSARNHRMALRRVAADDEHQIRLLKIGDRTRIAAIAHGAEQASRRGRLAVARAVVDVVRADDSSR